MPNELVIQPVVATPGSSESHAEPKPEVFPPPHVAAATPTQPYTNPSLKLDPALGLVVIEFRNDSGAVTSSIPSERQLAAYRTHQEVPPGLAPHGLAQAQAPPGFAEHESGPVTPPPAPTSAQGHGQGQAQGQAPLHAEEPAPPSTHQRVHGV